MLTAKGQQGVTFTASADPPQVVMGNYCKVTFTLTNTENARITPPQFPNFDVIHKESGSSYSFGAGGFTKSITASYYLRPKRLGTFTIGSAKANVNGKQFKTKLLKVAVVRPGDPGTPEDLLKKINEGEGIFLAAQPSTSNPYLGQQVIVDYKLYTAVGLERYNIISESKYPGFYAQDIQRFDNQVKIEDVEGQQYKTKVLQRVALFPQKTGLLTVDPIRMNVSIKLANQRRAIRQTLASDTLKLNVRSLPEYNQPEDYTGAIGRYDMQVFAQNSTLTTDDALVLDMILTGHGDVKQLDAPKLDLGENFEIYEPESAEKVYQENGFVAGSKTFRYMILPRKPGNYEFTPTASYFDTDSMRYVQLAPQSLSVAIGLGRNPLPDEEIPDAEDLEKELLPNRQNVSLAKAGNSFYGSIPFWTLMVLPLLALGFAFKRRQNLIAHSLIDRSVLKQQKAAQEAQKRLELAKKHLEKKESKAFYNEISHALWGYLSDKMSIPASDLTKKIIRDKLSNLPNGKSHADRVEAMIQTCEMALYASMDNADAMLHTYDDASSVIEDIENSILGE